MYEVVVLGVLIRGLQNLDVLCKEIDVILFASCKKNQKARSDVHKVAGGKFLCVGDRRNRENCART